MSFYIKRSLKAGPFRFNFSNSGVGVSVGVPGFRIGTGPRGNYIHVGRNGLYYRATLSNSTPPSSTTTSQPLPTSPPSSVEMTDIESAAIHQLQDSSSAELLAEINAKKKILSLIPFAIGLAVSVMLLLAALSAPSWSYIILLIIAAPLSYYLRLYDQARKTVVLFYRLEDEAELNYQKLLDAFKELRNCSRAWHVAARGDIHNIHERKRQAGASSLIQRTAIVLGIQAPLLISTNIEVPSIPVGKQILYLFPDRIIVYELGQIGAVSYANLCITLDNTRFIETGGVPSDAQIVGQTWLYVNMRGGPDRRFKNNRQVPITLYSQVHFTSTNGLNELIQLSRPDIGSSLEIACKSIAATLATLSQQAITPEPMASTVGQKVA